MHANIIIFFQKTKRLLFIIKINLLKNIIMGKERDIENLEHKIAEIEEKLDNYEKYDLTEKKIHKLEILKLQYEDELSELVF